MVEFKIEGYEMIRKVPSKHGTGGIVYVPKSWIGKNVIVVLEDRLLQCSFCGEFISEPDKITDGDDHFCNEECKENFSK